MGRYLQILKAYSRFFTTPEVRTDRRLKSLFGKIVFIKDIEWLPGHKFYNKTEFRMYDDAYEEDSGFINATMDALMLREKHAISQLDLYKCMGGSYRFSMKYSKEFYDFYLRDLQYNCVKFEFISYTERKIIKSFWMFLDFSRLKRTYIHDTNSNYSGPTDYQNLDELYKYFNENLNTRVLIKISWFRERFLNGK